MNTPDADAMGLPEDRRTEVCAPTEHFVATQLLYGNLYAPCLRCGTLFNRLGIAERRLNVQEFEMFLYHFSRPFAVLSAEPAAQFNRNDLYTWLDYFEVLWDKHHILRVITIAVIGFVVSVLLYLFFHALISASGGWEQYVKDHNCVATGEHRTQTDTTFNQFGDVMVPSSSDRRETKYRCDVWH